MTKLIATIILLLLAFINYSNAQWSTDPSVNTAISTTTLAQDASQIVSDGSGGAIITWRDFRSGSADIYVQRINSIGVVQWTANGVLICNASNGQISPQLVSDGSGGAIITWQDARSGTNDIYAQRVNSSGAAQWTANGVAICSASGTQNTADITSDGSSGAVITWQDARSGTNDIYTQRINSSGVVQWTANGVAICTATGNQTKPEITTDGSSGAIITWEDLRGANTDIYAQRVNSSGAVQWTADGIVIIDIINNITTPEIISDGNGGAFITWVSFGGSFNIFAQRVNSSGILQWNTNGVNICVAFQNQTGPQLVSDGNNGAIIAWQDFRSNSNHDIYAQRVNSSGVVQWTTDGVLVCSAINNQTIAQIVSDSSGGAIITWQDLRGADSDIYAQKINSSGLGQWTADGVLICSAINNQTVAQIVSDGNGGAIIIWQDTRGADNDVYAQNISSTGVIGLVVPTLTTITVSNILGTTASSGGEISTDGGTAITSRGVVWSTSTSPTVALATKTTNGSGSGTFTSSLTGLSFNTTYYVRAYATNAIGTGYGNEISFTTNASAVLKTYAVISNDSTNAHFVAEVVSDGGSPITQRGTLISTTANPTISNADFKIIDLAATVGSFSAAFTGLTNGKKYYARSYAINSDGISYSSDEIVYTHDIDGIEYLIEKDAPNSGDGNGDGIPDHAQNNVVSLIALNNTYITLANSDNTKDLINVLNYETPDNTGTHTYPYGVNEFRINASSATVTVYYHNVSSLGSAVYRKITPSGIWYAYDRATYRTVSLGGRNVLAVTLELTDGGSGDADGVANGVIVDPGGLAFPIVPPANIPTLSEWARIAMLSLMLAFGVYFVRKRLV